MPFNVNIIIGGDSVPAELNDTGTALAIVDALPVEAGFDTWGDEIYFSIPVKAGLDNGRSVVEAGDLGYWPPGNAFCIFYGPTPGSPAGEIRPASPVNIIGRVTVDPKIFKRLAGKNASVRIEKA